MSSGWTKWENKVFEDALVFYEDKPEFWQNVAAQVGGKTVDEVKRHYKKLLEDINDIENGPVPKYKSDGDTTTEVAINDQIYMYASLSNGDTTN